MIGAAVLIWGLWYARRVWLLCFTGVLFGIFLRHVAQWVAKRTSTSVLVSMAVVGTLIGIGLSLIEVPLPLALGLLAGLLEFIPFVGPLLAGTPAVLLAFTQSPMHALYVVALFVGVNFVEGHFLVPVVNRFSVSLPPAITLVSLVLLGSLFGFLGMLLAAPSMAAVLLLVRRVYVEGML